MNEIEAIHHRSGWDRNLDTDTWEVTPEGELFEGTVADRSWKKMIALFNMHEIGMRAHSRIEGQSGRRKHNLAMDPAETEVKEGIRLVSALIEGTIGIETWIEVTRADIARKVALEDATAAVRANVPLERRAMALAARRFRQRRQK